MAEDTGIILRKRELEVSERKFKSIFELSPLPAFLFDIEGQLIDCNRSAIKAIGFSSKNEMLGKSFFGYIHRDFEEIARERWIEILKKGVVEDFELKILDSRGVEKIVLTAGTVLLNIENRPYSVMTIMQDITHIKESEERLRRYAERVQMEKVKDDALLASIAHGVIAVDKNGKITFINKKALKFLNKDYEELAGKKIVSVLDLYDSKGRYILPQNRPLTMCLSGKKIITKDFYCINKKGKKILLKIAATPIIMRGKILGAIGIYEDITKEKEIENAKTEFVSLASHQLRTPITEISLSAEILMSGMAGKISAMQKKYIRNVNSAVIEITELIETLLNISRIQMGTFVVLPQPVKLQTLINKILSSFYLQAKKKKLKIKKHFDKNIPRTNLDPQIMQLILENLISNAVKYTEKGYVEIDVSVQNNKNIMIKISDTGCGIPDSQKHLVFTKLFRSDNRLKNETKGHGLGLFIVKSIVERVGGKIKFESEEKKGTTFYLTIPLKGMKKSNQQKLL